MDINKKENSKFVTHVLTELFETEIFVIYIRRVFAIYVKEKWKKYWKYINLYIFISQYIIDYSNFNLNQFKIDWWCRFLKALHAITLSRGHNGEKWTIFSPSSFSFQENLHAIKLQSVNPAKLNAARLIFVSWNIRCSTPLGLKVEFNYAS